MISAPPNHPGAAPEKRSIVAGNPFLPEVAVTDSLQWLKNATALVLVGGAPAGTAYLLTQRHAATCAHVIKPVGQGGEVTLKFRWGAVGACVTTIDSTADSAILTLDGATSVEPLPWDIETATENEALWLAYGYPGVTTPAPGEEPAPMLVRGTVRDSHAVDDWKLDALQLYCEDFAAGRGAMPHGMSGSPVIVRDRIVGHLKRIVTAADAGSNDGRPPASPRAELGIAYACPIAAAVKLLPEADQQPRVPQKDLLPPGSPYAPAWYVPREEDSRAWGYAKMNAPIWVHGGWRMGASWFIANLLTRISNAAALHGRALAVIPVDLGGLGLTHESSGDDFADKMAFAIGRRIGGDPERLRPAGRLPWPLRLTYWMEDEVLPHADYQIVLALEHFDALSGHPIEREVCFMLRRWVDQRPLLPPWSRLQPIIASTSSPATITLEGVYISPVATSPVQLEDFPSSGCEVLARAYGLGWTAADIDRDLHPCLGGHPLLFAVAVHHAAATGASLSRVRAHAETADGPFAAPLRLWLDELEKSAADMAALQRLLQDPGARVDKNQANRLRNMGVLIEVGRGIHRFRYPIQETYLRQRVHLSSRA
jgi:hypothetical protein